MNRATLATAAALGVLVLLALANQRGELLAQAGDAAPVDLGSDAAGDAVQEQAQGGAAFDLAGFLSSFDLAAAVQGDTGTQGDRNAAAFLMMIRSAEGTAGPDGYRKLFGRGLFVDMTDHPRQAKRFTDQAGRTLYTTAAGAFQFMAVSALPDGGFTKVNTWDRIAARLGLPDFSPDSQDAAALELIREAGALGDVHAGRVDAAISKVRRIWASMPGAGYAQPEKSPEQLRAAYAAAGGEFA